MSVRIESTENSVCLIASPQFQGYYHPGSSPRKYEDVYYLCHERGEAGHQVEGAEGEQRRLPAVPVAGTRECLLGGCTGARPTGL